MKKRYNKFLIVSSVFLLIGGVYLYATKSLNTDSLVPVAYGSSLASSIVPETSSTTTSTVGDNVSSDVSFLESLVSLKNLKLDVSFFQTEAYKSLKNNSVKIEAIPVTPGRVNPFAPMSSTETLNVSQAKSVVTDQATQITSTSANLNGTVNSAGTVTDTYFEYGTSQQGANNLVAIASKSLVGTFVKNVIGLNSGTTYYFKACAKINNVANCGDVVSFTTN